MLYLTQLIYIHKGQEEAFLEFESIAIPIIGRYHGKLEMRTRPTAETWVDGAMDMPYEIHLVSFETDENLQSYLNDEDRKKVLHLKEQSIKAVTLVKGQLF